MASRALQIAPRSRRRNPNPSSIHRFFSSSSTSNDADNNTPSPPSSSSSSSSSSLSSYFNDVKASLKQPPQPPRKSSSFSPSSPSTPLSSNIASLEEIRKNLSEFRSRSFVPNASPPQQSSSSSPISLEELYKRNVIPKPQDSPKAKPSFEAIRESLRQMRSSSSTEGGQTKGKTDPMSLSDFKQSLRLRPVDSGANKSSVVIGGSDDALPMSVFGRDMRERKEAESTTMKTEFVKTYSYDDLGEKLRKLRPETGGESGFSLKELNERLMKLREMEEEKTKSRFVGVAFQDLKDSLVKLSMAGDEKANRSSIQRLDILGHLGGTPSFMLAPPKEHLVEQYFHPDNMSSAEKLKIELKNVRDEFKMSESDCGSARVQVAQLTTKIKHLNSALHKKDKHSRKGLQAMVQRRKKLLKYLRRTDWDSYCLVLSKLGLRDNPDYKN